MTDEFDHIPLPPISLQHDAGFGRVHGRAVDIAPRLLARLYRSADTQVRASVLSCLLRPLGTLGLAAVSAGAFAVFIGRRQACDICDRLDEVARLSSAQVLELARFVDQVSPEALQQAASVLSENAMGLAAFGASAVVVLLRALRAPDPP